MTTSSRLSASGTGGKPFAVFTRLAAIFIGLVNLFVLALLNALLNDDGRTIRSGEVDWSQTLLVVLAVVVAGLVTSEIVLRRLRSAVLTEKFLDRYANSVVVVCLSGMLMGFLLAYVIALNALLLGSSSVSGPMEVLEWLLRAFGPGLVGAAFGLVLGLVEGVFLAFPLAAILRRFRSEG